MVETIRELLAIGFTEYEARVYVALLRESPASGYQVSKQAGVPRSMVYEALGRLEVRGAVLKTADRRATLYRPVPPDILMDRYDQEHRDRLQNLRGSLRALFASPPEDHVWSIRGRSSVMSYAVQMIEDAGREAMLVLTDDAVEHLGDCLAGADRRGVAVRAVLTGSSGLPVGQTVRHPPLESELQNVTRLLVVVTDDRQVLIADLDTEATATITSNPNLVMIARQFIWMELFTQRVHARIGSDLLARLEPQDRQILEGYATA
jgi:HTH-type transcriptional regulator, sugar sensing transcriptional regulator